MCIRDRLETVNIGEATTEIQEYDCWLTAGEEIDLEVESSTARAFKPDTVVAKSLGTVVALYAFAGKSNNMKFVFIGTPVNIYRREWQEMLSTLVNEANVLFIQQSLDRMGTIHDLRKILPVESEVVEVPGKDHLYNDVEVLSAAIESWFNRT